VERRTMATKKTAATDQATPADAVLASSKDAVETVMKASQEAMEMMNMEKAVDMAKEQVEKAQKAFFGGYDELTEMNVASFEAYIASFNIMTKGAEAFGKEFAAFTQKSMETSVENGKTMMGCKSVNEAVDLQNEIVKSSFDSLMAETSKLAEMSVKTTNDAIAPIQDQANQAFSKIFKPVAA